MRSEGRCSPVAQTREQKPLLRWRVPTCCPQTCPGRPHPAPSPARPAKEPSSLLTVAAGVWVNTSTIFASHTICPGSSRTAAICAGKPPAPSRILAPNSQPRTPAQASFPSVSHRDIERGRTLALPQDESPSSLCRDGLRAQLRASPSDPSS